MASLTIEPAHPCDLDRLAHVIAAAFADLPPSRWLVPEPGERGRIFPEYFRLYLEHGLRDGQLHTTSTRDAVAIWLPVASKPPAALDDYDARLAAITGRWLSRFRTFDALLDEHHPTGVRHDWLAILAVHPDRQRQGIGGALLEHHHGPLDREGVPAYLEASDSANVRLYRRHGFAEFGESIRLPGGAEMYPMWRPAAAGAAPTGRSPRNGEGARPGGEDR